MLEFTSGIPYYTTLYIYNGAGLENIITSEPIYFDATPPVNIGDIYVIPNYGSINYENSTDDINMSSVAQCVWDSNILTVQFTPFLDMETGIKDYQLGIGSEPGMDDILSFHSVDTYPDGNPLTYTITPLSLNANSRQPHYFTIRAFNYANLYTDSTSIPVYIKSNVNSLVSWVYDGDDDSKDIDYQYSTTYISGNAFFGVNCPMKRLEWAVESVDGALVKEFTEIDPNPISEELENTYKLSTDQAQLYEDETYRLLVRGIDYSGEVHVIKSNGVSVTTRQLLQGIVSEGESFDLQFQESVETLTIIFNNFGDGSDEQVIDYFEVALGSDREYIITRSDIVPFTIIDGMSTTYTFSGLNLIPLTQTYYATVRAHAVSGAIAEVTSNGIIVGLTHSITRGTIWQPSFQSNTSFLNVYWNGFESEVPIVSYEWALGNKVLSYLEHETLCEDPFDNYESEFEVFGFSNVDMDTVAMALNLELKHGMKYYVTLRVIDQSNKCIISQSSNPTLIDTTAPVGHNITIGPEESRINLETGEEYIAFIQDNNDLSLSWDDFTDPESDIERYEFGFFKLESCTIDSLVTSDVIIEYINLGLETSFILENPPIEFNTSYVAKIRATNTAGLTSSITSSPVLLDNMKLTSGDVKDGTSWETDLVFQSDLTKLSGVFSHSYFQPEYSGSLSDSPCPENRFYEFKAEPDDWSNEPLTVFDGLYSSALRYESDQVSFLDPIGVELNAIFDPTEKQLVSGVYYTSLSDLSGKKTVSLSVQAAIGDIEIQTHIVTSILFLETSVSDFLAEYDPELPFKDSSSFKALGLQIHTPTHNKNKHTLILWSNNDAALSQVNVISHDIDFDLSKSHDIRFEFTGEQSGLIFTRKVEVYIDDVIVLSLNGIPQFSSNGRMLLHLFNREGYLPECDEVCASDPPEVSAIFSNVSLPIQADGVCNYGSPFYSWGSPILEFKAALGTSPGLNDVTEFKVSNC